MRRLHAKLSEYVGSLLKQNSERAEGVRRVQRVLGEGDDVPLSAVLKTLQRCKDSSIFAADMEPILEQLCDEVDKSPVNTVLIEQLIPFQPVPGRLDKVRTLIQAAEFNNHMYDILLNNEENKTLNEEIQRVLKEYDGDSSVVNSDYFKLFIAWLSNNGDQLRPKLLRKYLTQKQKSIFSSIKKLISLPSNVKEISLTFVRGWLAAQEAQDAQVMQEAQETPHRYVLSLANLRQLLANQKIIEFLDQVICTEDTRFEIAFKSSLMNALAIPLRHLIINLNRLFDEKFGQVVLEEKAIKQLSMAMASTEMQFLVNSELTDLVKLSKLVQVAYERHESGRPLIALDQWLRASLEDELAGCLEASARDQFFEYFESLRQSPCLNQDWLRAVCFHLGNHTAFVAKRDGKRFDLSSTLAVTDLQKLADFEPSVVMEDGESWCIATMPLCLQYQNKNGKCVEQYGSLSRLKDLFPDLKAGFHESVSDEQLEKIRCTTLAVTHEYEDKPLRSYSLWAPIYQIRAQLSRNHGLVVDFEPMIKVVIQGLTPITFSVELVVNLNLREIKARYDGDSSLRFMGAEAKLGEIAIGLDIVEEAGQYRFSFKSGCVDYTPEYFLQTILSGGGEEHQHSFYLAAFNGDVATQEKFRSAISHHSDLDNARLLAKASGHQGAVDYMSAMTLASQGPGMWAPGVVAPASTVPAASAATVSRF